MAADSAGSGSTQEAAGGAHGFRKLGEEVRYRGWKISVTSASFESPDGDRFSREIVRHPGAVAIVPVNEERRALLVRQYRGPIDRELLEIPAGTRDVEGETPLETARRELSEEVGVSAGSFRFVASVYNTPGFCDEETFVYLATDLQPAEMHRDGEEERYMQVVEVPLGDIDPMITSGRLVDAQTIIGLLLARDVLDAGAPDR